MLRLDRLAIARTDVATLPLLQRPMAAARMKVAAGAAFVLVALTLAPFRTFDRWGRSHAAA